MALDATALRELDAARRALEHAEDLGGLARVTRRWARVLGGADGATFVVRAGDRTVYLDEEAISPLFKGQSFPIDACVAGWAIRHGLAVSVPDVYADPRIPPDVYRLTFVQSLLVVPVGDPAPSAAIGVYWARVCDPEAVRPRLEALAADVGRALARLAPREDGDGARPAPAP